MNYDSRSGSLHLTKWFKFTPAKALTWRLDHESSISHFAVPSYCGSAAHADCGYSTSLLQEANVTAFIIILYIKRPSISSSVHRAWRPLLLFVSIYHLKFTTASQAFIRGITPSVPISRTGAPFFITPLNLYCHFNLMHKALRIAEILDQISCHTDLGTLPSLASTCRTFEGPALDALWRNLPSLVPLVNCIPTHLWGFSFRGELVSISYSHDFHSVIRTDTAQAHRYQGLGYFS
jgi:hypothetical protein